jgi:hypothetical protein
MLIGRSSSKGSVRHARAVVGDKGCGSKANREAARQDGIRPVIPHPGNAARPNFFPPALCKGRARIEPGIGKLKRFKRIALLREKHSEFRRYHLPRWPLYPGTIRPHGLAPCRSNINREDGRTRERPARARRPHRRSAWGVVLGCISPRFSMTGSNQIGFACHRLVLSGSTRPIRKVMHFVLHLGVFAVVPDVKNVFWVVDVALCVPAERADHGVGLH